MLERENIGRRSGGEREREKMKAIMSGGKV